MKRLKTHLVTIRVRFDARVSNFEARYAVWQHLHGIEFNGDGRPGSGSHMKGLERPREPYDVGRVVANKTSKPVRRVGRPKKKPAPSVERDPNTIDMFEGLQQ